MNRLRPRAWLGFALLFFLALGFVFFVGVSGGGLDVQENCERAGQNFDTEYRHQNWQESGQFFPLHGKCNAGFDLVPGWINPALVFFAVAVAACLVGAVAATTRLIRNSR